MNNNRPTISATQALDEIEEQRAAAGLPPLSDCDVESLFYGTDADRAALLELLRDLAGITISGDLEPVRVSYSCGNGYRLSNGVYRENFGPF